MTRSLTAGSFVRFFVFVEMCSGVGPCQVVPAWEVIRCNLRLLASIKDKDKLIIAGDTVRIDSAGVRIFVVSGIVVRCAQKEKARAPCQMSQPILMSTSAHARAQVSWAA